VKECPILFSAPMIRALLAGTKTQTRRIAKIDDVAYGKPVRWISVGPCTTGLQDVACPYGVPGDRLWVREAFSGARAYETHGYPLKEWGNKIWFWADGNPERGDWTKPRPSIHMPRALSRITLEVVDVRVERLQDISEADSLAEGIVKAYDGYGLPAGEHFHAADPRKSYLSLWEAINGPGSVEANPLVWAVKFRRLAP
jgi:hypothetical protein